MQIKKRNENIRELRDTASTIKRGYWRRAAQSWVKSTQHHIMKGSVAHLRPRLLLTSLHQVHISSTAGVWMRIGTILRTTRYKVPHDCSHHSLLEIPCQLPHWLAWPLMCFSEPCLSLTSAWTGPGLSNGMCCDWPLQSHSRHQLFSVPNSPTWRGSASIWLWPCPWSLHLCHVIGPEQSQTLSLLVLRPASLMCSREMAKDWKSLLSVHLRQTCRQASAPGHPSALEASTHRMHWCVGMDFCFLTSLSLLKPHPWKVTC